ncbi:MAG: protease self-immunity [Gemmatimonadetes bacterium]|nr:protease self-immunity [Gemmatimonadota bacterium]
MNRRTGVVTAIFMALIASGVLSVVVLAWIFMPPAYGLAYEVLFISIAAFFWAGQQGAVFLNAPLRLRACTNITLTAGLVFAGCSMAEHYWIPRQNFALVGHAASSPWGISSLLLSISLGAPLAEEAVFRGMLLRELRRSLSDRASICLSAAAFTALHLDPTRAPEQFVAGVLLAVVVIRTGRLWLAVAMHSAMNLGGLLESGVLRITPYGAMIPAVGATVAIAAGITLWRVLRSTDWSIPSTPM